ncbi:unnamed protein product, partial [Ectocarpus sp. 13 AM-2016]
RVVAIRRQPCATGAGARTGSARSPADAEVVAPSVERRRHRCEQRGGLHPVLRWVLVKLGRSRVPPDPNHPSRLDHGYPGVLPTPWHSLWPL